MQLRKNNSCVVAIKRVKMLATQHTKGFTMTSTNSMSTQHTPGHCEKLAQKTGLPPICGACNLGPCPHWKDTRPPAVTLAALHEIMLHAVRRQAAGGDIYDFQDTLRQCADMARAAIAKATGSAA